MVDKEKMELLNLRRRVQEQRAEIKRLTKENHELRNAWGNLLDIFREMREASETSG